MLFLPTNFNTYKPHKLCGRTSNSDSPTPTLSPINDRNSKKINDVRRSTNIFVVMATEDANLVARYNRASKSLKY